MRCNKGVFCLASKRWEVLTARRRKYVADPRSYYDSRPQKEQKEKRRRLLVTVASAPCSLLVHAQLDRVCGLL